jgi:hypothetical protein
MRKTSGWLIWPLRIGSQGIGPELYSISDKVGEGIKGHIRSFEWKAFRGQKGGYTELFTFIILYNSYCLRFVLANIFINANDNFITVGLQIIWIKNNCIGYLSFFLTNRYHRPTAK